MKFRSIIYLLIFIIWSLTVAITFLPLLFSKETSLWTIRFWSRGILISSNIFLKINLKVNGQENILKGPCIIAPQHQSSFETYILFLIIKRPVFVVKESLHKIPIVGWYIRRSGSIGIDRSGGLKSLKKVLYSMGKIIENNEQIIIFPEGTRKEPTNYMKIQSGISAIYSHSKLPVIPVTLNSGFFWRKNNIIKKRGTIIIDFGDPIFPGLDRKSFEIELAKKIKDKSLLIFNNKK